MFLGYIIKTEGRWFITRLKINVEQCQIYHFKGKFTQIPLIHSKSIKKTLNYDQNCIQTWYFITQ